VTRTRRPIATHVLLIIQAMAFLAMLGEGTMDAARLRHFFIEAAPAGIWSGNYFSLLAAAFIHLGPLHLAFNGLWIYLLGKAIELTYGAEVLAGLAMLGALAPYAWELGLGGWPVYGSTAMMYTFYGFALAGSWIRPGQTLDLRKGTRRVLGAFLPICCALGWLSYGTTFWPCGVAAPLIGFLMGLAVGTAVLGRRAWRWGAGALILLLLAGGMIGAAAPTFNPEWRFWRATRLAAEGKTQQARSLLETMMNHKNPVILNQIAWLLATAPDPRMRDGKTAVVLARRACSLAPRPIPALLDTLAAAYAETGNWAGAERIERHAISQLEIGSTEDDLRTSLKSNLERIQRHQPIRDYDLFGLTPTSGTVQIQPGFRALR
jgi:membrane associated rhomboid family serine protease